MNRVAMKRNGWMWGLVCLWCMLALPVDGQTAKGVVRQGGVEVCRVRLVPDVPMNEVRVEALVRVPRAGRYTLTCQRSCYPDEDPAAATLVVPLRLQQGENEVEALIDMGENPHLWSEFHPDLYRLRITLADRKGVGEEVVETLALRQWEAEDDAAAGAGTPRWMLNGLAVLLRPVDVGRMNLPVPVDGAPSADWLRFFRHAREQGFNHLHQPLASVGTAMLAAADTVGFYLSVDDLPDTAGRFANHPSLMPPVPHADTLLYAAPLALVVETADTLLPTDTLTASVLLANYTEDDHRQPVRWQLRSVDADGHPDGHFSAEGEEDYVDAPQGEVSRVATLNVPLSGIQPPRRLRLNVSTEGATLSHDVQVERRDKW